MASSLITSRRRAELAARGHQLHYPLRHGDHSSSVGRSSAKGCGNGCEGNSPSRCGTSASGNFMLGRDRFGIAPLYWTRQGDWLLFASEIKGAARLRAWSRRGPIGAGSIMSSPFPRCRGRVTCFEGVQLLPRGPFPADHAGERATAPAPMIEERAYWEMDFPDRGRRGTRRRSEDSWSTTSRQSCSRPSRNGCGRMCRSAPIFPAASIRA